VTGAKYIGLDVHQATISAAVLDSTGKLVMESILETKAATILQFVQGFRRCVHVALEEKTCAAWLHDLLKPHVTNVLVCETSLVREQNGILIRTKLRFVHMESWRAVRGVKGLTMNARFAWRP
jgi:hypothetical protein